MDDKCDDDMNLRTLRQIDEHINGIILFAGQVAVYKYSFAINEWERKEIEGSMFIVSRKALPNHSFVVINRLNTTNMYETISNTLDTKLQVPYLLYKNDNNEIYCIWFYNEDDCSNVYQKLTQLITLCAKPRDSSRGCGASDGSKPNTQTKHEMQIFQRLLSVDHNSCDNDKLQRNNNTVENGFQRQTSQPPQPPQPSQLPQTQQTPQTPQTRQTPQRRSLQVQDLFNSQMAALSLENNSMAPQDVNHSKLNDSLINEMIAPSMLNEKSNSKQKELIEQNKSQPKRPQQSPLQTPLLTQPIIQSYTPSATIQPLTMEQLKQTLIHLLKNDADFLHSIHTAYSAAVSSRK